MTRGALIVFEGCDRSGKTTQTKLLVDKLQKDNYSVECFKFPDRNTSVGCVLNSYLQTRAELEPHVVQLLFSANRWEFRNKIVQLLQTGTIVVLDRYSYSGIAYSGMTQTSDANWCKQLDTGLPAPDLIIYLDVDLSRTTQREGYGAERYESINKQRDVQKCYESLFDEKWKIIHASGSIADIHEEVIKECLKIMKSSRHKPVRFLWD